ncbi:ComEC family competence protein [Candidatus Parcubacteria bacterium]|nr:ComEC family competence protein [Patescibacteria group bacterium]MBU4309403.1 ComEC family competence protein [Patescibacteria group bacterium]MBU4431974.1 ComEC family competence protein [Patescibacteria group bacterium]MBU4577764.1 ComEC family competence protein [Patescibacteria group bacterium]MCG2697449.1 ComEC family competence protein [Candidatus Parcubacteria bacterium]
MLPFSKSKLFFYSCLAFITGITIASFLPISFLKNDIQWFAASIIFTVLTFLVWNTANKKHILINMFFLLSFFALLGIWRFSLTIPKTDANKIWYYNNQEVQLIGKVSEEPSLKKSNQKITLNNLQIAKQEFKLPRPAGEGRGEGEVVEGKVLVTTNLYPEFAYGDVVSLTCKLKAPEEFEGFAYDKYLARYDIYSVCYYPKNIKKLDTELDVVDLIYSNIYKFKNILRTKINQGMSEPEASFGRAMILGDMGAMDENLNNSFARTGLSHVISISGSHVAILIVILAFVFLALGFWRQQLFYVISITLTVYIIMIGATAAAVRSLVMGMLVLLGIHLGRLNRMDISLVFAAAVMLLFNPMLLRYDAGFQLSFLAVFAIIFLHPQFLKLYAKLIDKYPFLNRQFYKIFFEIISISLLIQILTFPILFFSFKQFSLIAPLANLLILWTLPFLLASLIAGLIASFVFPSFALVLFFPAKISLAYIIFIAQTLEKLPWAYLKF